MDIVILMIFLAAVTYIFLSLVIGGTLSFAPYVPARSSDLERIASLAGLRDGDTFYDLGCGDGKIVFHISRLKNVKATGIESSFILYLACLAKKILPGNNNAEFKRGDLFAGKYPDADAVFIYPNCAANASRVYGKLKGENKKPLKLIIYRFSVPDIKADLTDKPERYSYPIYLYRL